MNKTKLSKNVLQMKFMKRTREKVEKEEDEEEGRTMYSAEITDKMLHGGNSNIIIEPSYVICEGLIECGRFSYGGMNKHIERLMELEQQEKSQKATAESQLKQKEMKKDVNDEDMLKYYSSLMQTMKDKFHYNKKRKHGKSGKFLKPADDSE